MLSDIKTWSKDICCHIAPRKAIIWLGTIQYFDGLGRPLQTVTWQGSPTGKDLVQVFEYDALGREAKKYLPYAEQTAGDGSYKPSGIATQGSFYQPSVGWDANR